MSERGERRRKREQERDKGRERVRERERDKGEGVREKSVTYSCGMNNLTFFAS